MTTDTAVNVTRRVIEGQGKLSRSKALLVALMIWRYVGSNPKFSLRLSFLYSSFGPDPLY